MPTHLSLLHVSDFHFSNRYTPWNALLGHEPSVAAAVARFAHENQSLFDAVLVTGDLARTGAGRDLIRADEYFFSPPWKNYLNRKRKPTLAAANCKIFILPGNHDRYHDVYGAPACNNFGVLFGSHWRAGVLGVQRITFPALDKRPLDDTYRLHVLCADFCLHSDTDAQPPGKKRVLGQGKAHETPTLKKLISETNRARQGRDAINIVVWALHFPPVVARNNNLQLVDHTKVVAAARSLRVPLVLSGHIHESDLVRPSALDEPHVFTAGSAAARWLAAQNNRIHLLSFQLGDKPVNRVRVNITNYEFDLYGYFGNAGSFGAHSSQIPFEWLA